MYLERLGVMEQEMLAAIESARGDYLAAAKLAAEASRLEGDMPFAFGPPFVDWPSAELLGELLFKSRKYAESAAAYELELERARLRANSLLGLAGAQEKQGLDSEAAYNLARLAEIWKNADRGEIMKLNEVAEGLSSTPENP